MGDLKNSSILQALVCLALSLALGLTAARYLAPPSWAMPTMIGASLIGLASVWAIIKRKPKSESSAAPYVSDRGSYKGNEGDQGTRSFQALQRFSTADLFLVVNVFSSEQSRNQNGNEELFRFLEHVKGSDEGLNGHWLERILSGAASNSKIQQWVLKNSTTSVIVEFIEFPVDLNGQLSDLPGIAGVLRDLGLSTSRLTGFWNILRTRRFPQHPDVKGIVLCCPIRQLEKNGEAALSFASNYLSALRDAIRSKFPLYIVVTGLEAIEGFAEFTTYLGESRYSSLSEPVGTSFTGAIANRSDIQQNLVRAIRKIGEWRPAVLEREEENFQKNVAISNKWEVRNAISAESSERRADLYELPRKLQLNSGNISSFCWQLLTRLTTLQSGPVLRGVFYSGLSFGDAGSQTKTRHDSLLSVNHIFIWKLVSEQLITPAADVALSSSDLMRTYAELPSAARRRILFVLGGALSAALAVLIGVFVSALLNTMYLREARASINQVNSTISDNRIDEDALRKLAKLRRDSIPQSAWMHFGLYQGQRVKSELQKSYFAAAATLLINPVLQSIEQSLASPNQYHLDGAQKADLIRSST